MATDFSNIFGRQPSYLDGLLSDEEINNLQKQANTQAIFNIAAGLLEAGSPSREPTSLGQGIARGFFGGQKAYQDAYKNALQGLMMEEKLRPLKTQRDVQAKLEAMPNEKPNLFIDKVADGGGVVNYSQLFDVPLRDGKASTQGMGTGLSGGQQFGLNMENVNNARLGLLESEVGKYAPSYSPTTSDTMFGTAEQVPAPSVFLPSQKGVEIGTLDPNTGESTLRELPEVMIDPETGVARARTPLDMFNVSDRATSPRFSDTRLARQALELMPSSLPLQDAVMQTTTTMSELDKIRALKADPKTTADEIAYLRELEKAYVPDAELQTVGDKLLEYRDGRIEVIFDGSDPLGSEFYQFLSNKYSFTPEDIKALTPNDREKLYNEFSAFEMVMDTRLKQNAKWLNEQLKKVEGASAIVQIFSDTDKMQDIMQQKFESLADVKRLIYGILEGEGIDIGEERRKELDSITKFEQIKGQLHLAFIQAMGGARGMTDQENKILADALISTRMNPEARMRVLTDIIDKRIVAGRIYDEGKEINRAGKLIVGEIDTNVFVPTQEEKDKVYMVDTIKGVPTLTFIEPYEELMQ
tara:strand:- start:2111 stop:3859 length:1749 start_codon:yes stop_codon:yes gene_type:complete